MTGPFLFVPDVGLEPTRLATTHFECAASAIPPIRHALLKSPEYPRLEW